MFVQPPTTLKSHLHQLQSMNSLYMHAALKMPRSIPKENANAQPTLTLKLNMSRQLKIFQALLFAFHK